MLSSQRSRNEDYRWRTVRLQTTDRLQTDYRQMAHGQSRPTVSMALIPLPQNLLQHTATYCGSVVPPEFISMGDRLQDSSLSATD